MSFSYFGQLYLVIPAKAGIHHLTLQNMTGQEMDSRLRGNDDLYFVTGICSITGVAV